MAIVTLQTPINVSNPEARKRMVRAALHEMDDRLALLQCVADSAAASQADDEIQRSLYVLHGEMKQKLDTLLSLT